MNILFHARVSVRTRRAASCLAAGLLLAFVRSESPVSATASASRDSVTNAAGPGTGAGPAKARRAHWAFQPPVRPPVPRVNFPVRNPIDAFVLARLEKEGLALSPEADRATLLRRLSLDLTGLPPSLAELDAFLQDQDPDAYPRQVERLFQSPHHGERWGRLWLDAARYADSNGYEKDRAREAWHYRDWVVSAFNRDLPYDRFIVEQFAGDLLPDGGQEQLIATGFLRNSMINEEGAIDPEQFRMDAMFDRMDCVGKAVLGLTIQCSQCHDHKYDPLTQVDYYRMFAFLNDADEFTAPVYGPGELARRDRVMADIRSLEAGLKRDHPDWERRMAEWEASVRSNQPGWVVLDPYEAGAPDGLSKLQPQRNKSLLAGGHSFHGGTWFVKARTTLTNITGVRLEALANGNLPMNGPGRSAVGMFALREFRLQAAPLDQPTNMVRIPFASATADFQQAQEPAGPLENGKEYTGPVQFAIDDNDKTFWTIDAGPGRRNTDRKAVFQVATNLGFASGTELRFDLACREEIACFRISVTSAPNPVADPLPRAVREALALPAAQRSAEQQAAVFSYWRTTVAEFAGVNARIEASWREYPAHTGTTLALQRRPELRPTHVLKRGDWLKPAEVVAPGVPAFLPPLPAGEAPTRLSFARWLVDRRSPTTARVFVNRVWQAYFGTGLVTTPEDFGIQSEPPVHPELLDWLACEFMDHGWSVRHLHRLIVQSATYRQSSRIPAALHERDPYNRLLARGPRFRVDGEVVRDIPLAVSGLLDSSVGGPSVYAPAPAFLFVPPSSYQSFPWKDATGRERYRRALYTFRRRSTPYPMLQNFDTPNGDSACIRRLRSNTPLQALTALNEPVFMECAQALALKVLTEGGDSDDQRVGYAFRRTLSRPPTDTERSALLGLLQRQRQYIADGWVNASEIATGAAAPPAALPPGVSPTQVAAYTVVARVLLNLDEAITKE